jgi:hypothetical protein
MSPSGGSSVGGAVAGVVVALLLVIGIVVVALLYRRSRRARAADAARFAGVPRNIDVRVRCVVGVRVGVLICVRTQITEEIALVPLADKPPSLDATFAEFVGVPPHHHHHHDNASHPRHDHVPVRARGSGRACVDCVRTHTGACTACTA